MYFYIFLFDLKGLYFAGLFLFNTGKYDKAREYIDRMLKMAPKSTDVSCHIFFFDDPTAFIFVLNVILKK